MCLCIRSRGTQIKLFWQNRGDYLCVQVKRQKTKKLLATNFEIFRMKYVSYSTKCLVVRVCRAACSTCGCCFRLLPDNDHFHI